MIGNTMDMMDRISAEAEAMGAERALKRVRERIQKMIANPHGYPGDPAQTLGQGRLCHGPNRTAQAIGG